MVLYKTFSKEDLDTLMNKEEYIEMKLNDFNDLLYLIEVNNFDIKSFKFYIKKEEIKEFTV
jgi:hypothetical protein